MFCIDLGTLIELVNFADKQGDTPKRQIPL